MEHKAKKTDRRTLYTRRVIQEAFLRIKRTKAYSDITVADICREAEISRGTFYLHYRNTADVLDEVLNEALAATNTLEQQLYPSRCPNSDCGYPMCQYIRGNDAYRCLFFDDALSSQILEKIYAVHKDDIVKLWARKTELSREQLEMIAWFQLSGCFAAAKKSGDLSDESWAQTQALIDTFLRSGLDSLNAGAG